MTLKNVRLFYRENADESQGVSEYRFLYQELWGHKLGKTMTGISLADPNPRQNQKTSFGESTAFYRTHNCFMHSLTVVVVSKSQVQL